MKESKKVKIMVTCNKGDFTYASYSTVEEAENALHDGSCDPQPSCCYICDEYGSCKMFYIERQNN